MKSPILLALSLATLLCLNTSFAASVPQAKLLNAKKKVNNCVAVNVCNKWHGKLHNHLILKYSADNKCTKKAVHEVLNMGQCYKIHSIKKGAQLNLDVKTANKHHNVVLHAKKGKVVCGQQNGKKGQASKKAVYKCAYNTNHHVKHKHY
ncbi:MAG: hypothetical protein OXD32_02760 [Endozoicomonadaceae bacterium]|nr:hypothetical protein [Endozoicomonadaceae bacterium]